MMQKNIRISKAEFPFHTLIKPAGPVCNLRCDYCFYLDKTNLFPDKKTSDFMMSEDVLEELVRQIIQSQPDYITELNIGWQGGEPMIRGLEFFKKAVEAQKRNNPDNIRITNSIQTNGTLINSEWAEFFANENFLVGISLDGPERMHNKFRKDPSGRGSFREVMNGLELLQRYNIEFNTLTVVQSDNAEYANEVYSFLKKNGSGFIQFIPIVEHINGKLSERTVSARQWGNFLITVFRQWLEGDIGRFFIQQFDAFLSSFMGYPSGICVFDKSCGRAVAAEHNGNIYSCDHFVSEDYFLGNIMENELSDMIDGPFQTEFGAAKSEKLPAACKRCKFLKLCRGGCPKNRIIKTSKGKKDLNHLCAGYKAFFRESLPYFTAMSSALNNRLPASDYHRYMD